MLAFPSKEASLDNLVHRYHIYQLIKSKCIDNEKKLPVCRKIIEDYNLSVTPEQLRERYTNFIENKEKFDKRCKFDAKTEMALVGLIKGFVLAFMPISRADFIDHVRSFYVKDEEWDADGWLQNFLKRYESEIRIGNVSALDYERVSKVSIVDCERFINNFEEYHLNQGIPSKLIFNIDEKRLCVNPKNLRFKALITKKLSNPYFRAPKGSLAATYIPVISCNSILIHFIVIPNSFSKESEDGLIKATYYTRNSIPPLYRLTTETGYVTKECWLKILQHFITHLRKIEKEARCMLILDNLSMHTSAESVKLCNDNNIIHLTLPCYSTSWSQPLDDLVFAELQKQYTRKYVKMMRTSTRADHLNADIARNFANFTEIITKQVIKRSWSNVGLFPFNRGKFMARAKEACQIQEEPNNLSITDQVASQVVNLIQTSQKERENESNKRSRTDVKKKSSKITCYSQFHPIKENGIVIHQNDMEICESCLRFSMCHSCYEKYPEVLASHAETCENLRQLRNKKKRRERVETQ